MEFISIHFLSPSSTRCLSRYSSMALYIASDVAIEPRQHQFHGALHHLALRPR
jgi:hypothetical protein